MSDRSTYSLIQIGLHWLVAVLVLAAWFLSEGMGRLLHDKIEGHFAGGLPLHVIFGVCVMAAVIIRIGVRMAEGAPDAAPGTPDLLARAAHWLHVLLYVLMAAVPLLGMAAWFGEIEISGEVHGILGNAILWAAGLHAAAALYHHYVLKDGTLKRMMTPRP